MENKPLFKNTACNVEGTIKPGQKKVKVEWLFDKISREDIATKDNGSPATFVGCGCTADVEVSDTGIVAYYNDSTKLKSSARVTVSKNIRVYLKDGNPLMVKNKKGILTQNVSGKSNILLTFNVVVQK